jgi:hypothetical protein
MASYILELCVRFLWLGRYSLLSLRVFFNISDGSIDCL